MRRSRTLALFMLPVLSAATLFALLRPPADSAKEPPLAAYAPPGALLALESPDFHALLASWTSSPEEQRWLGSDDYAGFSRSRLFGRLKEAQDQFATSAGLPPDAPFLAGVAGRQSLFAWYDIGNLEFLYLTRLPPGEAARTPLLALRDRYEARNAGGTPFYVRTEGDAHRTVAFAVHGDLLLLATREDLIANALQLLAQPAPSTLEHEPWYAAAQAAAAGPRGDLHMTLNLASVVPSPYFRSYWIQQNITEMKAYSAVVSDLYRTPGEFREERVLLPKSSATEAAARAPVDLAPVLQLLPAGAVYRAAAHPGTGALLDQMEDKLLNRAPPAGATPQTMPIADLSTPTPGAATDLEERIDQPPLTAPSRAVALAPLRAQIDAAAPSAMLVFSRLDRPGEAASDSPVFSWVHTAVVVLATTEWNQSAVTSALTSAVAPGLSIGESGLTWEAAHNGADVSLRLRGFAPMALAFRGKLCVLASDEATLQAALAAAHGNAAPVLAEVQAGADLAAAREPLTALARRLDHTTTQPAGSPGAPPFLSGNMLSLGNTFADLASETFTQTTPATAPQAAATVHQQVIYRWIH